MQRYNKEFINQLGELAPSVPYTPSLTAERLHTLVMDRFTVTTKQATSRKGFKCTVLVAALITVSLFIIAATYYTVSDAFRGVLYELSPSGEKVPLSSLSPVVDKTGKLVSTTADSHGVRVGLRAITAHDNGLSILVDITGPEGKPLALLQPDGTLSSGKLEFGYIKMRTEDTQTDDESENHNYLFCSHDIELGQSSSNFSSALLPDDNPFDNKATLLLNVNMTTQTPLTGKTLFLSLENLLQEALLNGTDVGMKHGELAQLFEQFTAPSPSDFKVTGSSLDEKTGKRISRYSLTKDSDIQLPLATGLPGYLVTNAAIRDDVLYLRGVAPIPTDKGKILPHAALLNPKTGEIKLPYTIGTATDDSQPDLVQWAITVDGITSKDDLNDYVLILNAGNGAHPLLKGKWEFTIPLDLEKSTRIFPLDKSLSVQGETMHATKLTVSPYYLSLLTSMDEATYRRIQLSSDRADNPSATVIMMDNTQIKVLGDGRSGTANSCEIMFSLDVVIDPDQIKSFVFGDLTIDMQTK